MIRKHSEQVESKGVFYECMEAFAREKIREWVQDLLDQEVTELLGRDKSERKAIEVEQLGYRNGYGRQKGAGQGEATSECYDVCGQSGSSAPGEEKFRRSLSAQCQGGKLTPHSGYQIDLFWLGVLLVLAPQFSSL